MACPYCQGDATQELERITALGYRLFRCRPCRRTFNERTGTPFNHPQVPTDIALLVVLWRLRYKLSQPAGDVPHVHVRDRAGVGGALRPTAVGAIARQAAR